MRQLLTLLLSCGVVFLAARAPARAAETLDTLADKQVQLAQLDLTRIKELVELGALPRVRVLEAEAKLEDAKDEAILAHNMYANLPDQGAMEQTSEEMVAAAQRRVDRQRVRMDEAQKMVDAGVAAKTYIAPFEAELSSRQTALDLAHLRAHLMADLAAAKPQPPIPALVAPTPLDDSELSWQGMEHYEGDGAFDEARDLPPLEFAFSTKFDRPLPISAEGETEVHRALGFDHRGRVDVAVVPNAPEGVWLRQYLQLRKIPYYAFSRAIPGRATAAHIHIGPGSTRLASEVTGHVSKHPSTRTHVAD
jgi:hypothetical protein